MAAPSTTELKPQSSEVQNEEAEKLEAEEAEAAEQESEEAKPEEHKPEEHKHEKSKETARGEDSPSVPTVNKSNCDDQTCTTTYCLPDGKCVSKSCNIYDTNMKGECQEFAHLQMAGTTVTSVDVTTFKESGENHSHEVSF